MAFEESGVLLYVSILYIFHFLWMEFVRNSFRSAVVYKFIIPKFTKKILGTAVCPVMGHIAIIS